MTKTTHKILTTVLIIITSFLPTVTLVIIKSIKDTTLIISCGSSSWWLAGTYFDAVKYDVHQYMEGKSGSLSHLKRVANERSTVQLRRPTTCGFQPSNCGTEKERSEHPHLVPHTFPAES